MAATVRLLVLSIFVSYQCGCHQEETTPVFAPIARITARLHSIPEIRISGIETVEVPENELSTFAKLITPVGPCTQQIKPRIHYLVADVVIDHIDGSMSNLIVRWTGHNPAAVSFDGIKYYYGGLDEFPDGATRIIRLLRDYDFNLRASANLQNNETDQSSPPSNSADPR